jgi:MIP family channel proteins
MKDPIRHFAAEFIGTFALVFFGGAAIIHASARQSGSALVEVALVNGLILFAMVTATMRISGHFNPAVTIAFLATRRIEAMMATVYVIAQIMGGVIGAYALKALLPAPSAMAARLGGQSISIDVTASQAFGLEAIATFILVFVVFGTAVDQKAPRVGGLAIGLVFAAAIMALGPLTGASLNPARSFGPAIASGIFEGQAVFWIGPILGGLAAGLLYEHLFMRHGIEPVDHGAVRPIA